MKSTISSIAAVLFAITVLAGCKSSTDSASSSTPSNGATINGAAWAPDVPVTAMYASAVGMTTVAEMDSKQQMIQLVIPGAPASGTFTIGSKTSGFTGQFVKGGTMSQYVITSGSVTVSAGSSTHITGTFNFHALNTQNTNDSVVVTGGGFDAAVTSM